MAGAPTTCRCRQLINSYRKDGPTVFSEVPSERVKGNRQKSQILIGIRKNVPRNEDDQMLQWDQEEWEKHSSLETSKIQLDKEDLSNLT